ncbi:hypothetical protein [Amycolatopsis benzoatilytica]|uniref:hypothetical protein n=1 Tax=Amycolatopsis benzoatilytica TaxID=346045 RepID=UPI000484987D|nr:hypothetical protein [Amycolatopsis benzoatilytica]
MLTSTRFRAARVTAAAGVVAAAGLLAAACGSGGADPGTSGTDHSGMPMTSAAAPASKADGMPGMDDMPTGDGLAAESSGFRFVPAATSVPAGKPASLSFRITDAAGKPVTAFEPDQTKLMHFYLIRSDLTGFQHVHPAMAADGPWTAPLAAAQPGAYRAYASFTAKNAAGKPVPLVLSQQLTVPGDATPAPLPPPSTTTQADGYTLSLGSDQLMSGMSHELTVTVAKDGKPVTDLQPYLDTYAHLTAFHEGDLAFAHLHPQGTVNGDHGGPALTFEAMLPKPGSYRLFVQFQTGGVVHTAPATVRVS